jgi:hypothetical protein
MGLVIAANGRVGQPATLSGGVARQAAAKTGIG